MLSANMMTTSASYDLQLKEADALQEAGRFDQAINAYHDAILTNPDAAEGHFRLAIALEKAGDRQAAKSSYQQALRLRRDFPSAAVNLANLYIAEGNVDGAEPLLRAALAEQPDLFPALVLLGSRLAQSGRAVEGVQLLRRATSIDPTSAMAWAHLGEALRKWERHAQAIEALQRALAIDDRYAAAWNSLGANYYDLGSHEQARQAFARAVELDRKMLPAWSNLLLLSNYTSTDIEGRARIHREFGAYLEQLAGDRAAPCPDDLDPDRPLRIGFVSGDLRQHSVSYFIESFMPYLDGQQAEVWAYFTHSTPDERSEALRPLFANWVDIRHLKDDAATDLIRRNRIDILVDLGGHTSHGRLGIFARKAAPVQVTWIGYPNTTGLRTIHYRLTDSLADPVGMDESNYTEALWRLPDCFLSYAPPKDAPPVAPPPYLSEQVITFGSFNSRQKLGDECFALWARVLAAIPNSRLALKAHVNIASGEAREALLAQAASHGINPERILLLPPADTVAEHLGMYGVIDICLDSFPYHGTTTTCEALWMGVPVISRMGDCHAARVGASLLTNAGLSELIAHDDDEFVATARRLASCPDELSRLRASLRQELVKTPLLDGPGMARRFEAATRSMWKEYCKQHAPYGTVNHTNPSAGNRTVTLADGVRFVTEDGYSGLSAWVALEQEDWFEDEIKFVRTACRSDWTALDVGANHGIYSLALAARGATVLAFEPTNKPLSRFRESVTINGFDSRIKIFPVGLSDRQRTAGITICRNSEHNSLHVASTHAMQHEMVQLVDLDSFLGTITPPVAIIDFVKLDAEGEEEAILRGGQRFFMEQSPLVMFEFVHDKVRNVNLLAAFRKLGYGIYRLVPGVNCLVSVEAGDEESLDEFVPNLFACKLDRALQLESDGLLSHDDSSAPPEIQRDWLVELRSLPLYATCASDAPLWNLERIEDRDYVQALLAWCGSRQLTRHGWERIRLLMEAKRHILASITSGDGHPATALLGIRIFADVGERFIALDFARSVAAQILPDDIPDDRPVPPCLSTYDRRQIKASPKHFLFASVLEFILTRSFFSSYYDVTRESLLNALLSNPEHSAEAERRAILCCIRDERPLRLPVSAEVFTQTSNNLNPGLWVDIAADQGILDGFRGRVTKPVESSSPEGASLSKIQPICDLLGENERITIVDVGASFNGAPPYECLLSSNKACLVGFEPDPEEHDRLCREYGPPHRFLSCFVGDGKTGTYHETNWVLTGSLYKPNEALVKQFSMLHECMTLVAEHRTPTTRLDDLPELGDVDYLKMDVQGAELMILMNSERILEGVVCIQVEVEFVELYEKQPLFADVDAFLRSKGFQLHTFTGFGTRCFSPLRHPDGSVNGYRQVLWSDAVYVRDWMHFNQLKPEKLRKLAVVLNDIYHSPDLAHLALRNADSKTGATLADTWLPVAD